MANRNANRKISGSVVRERQVGNTVQVREELRRKEDRPVSQQVSRNRERTQRMNMGYVIFLALTGVLTVTICINYLKLQSVNVALQKRVTSLTTQLKDAQMENDTVYNEIIANVDLEKIKEYAMNTLGMTYPAESQIVTYEPGGLDYVKQFVDIPD